MSVRKAGRPHLWRQISAASAEPCPIETGGEFFPDGRSISLVRDSSTERLELLLADGNIEIIDTVIEYAGHTRVPPDLADSFHRTIVFPEEVRDFGSTTASIMNFGLLRQAALLAVYFLLFSWFELGRSLVRVPTTVDLLLLLQVRRPCNTCTTKRTQSVKARRKVVIQFLRLDLYEQYFTNTTTRLRNVSRLLSRPT